VGLGKDETDMLGDFWVYDPLGNEWDTLNAVNVGPNARYGAIAFTINNIGYVGTGNDGSNLKDLWAYDPSTNSWTQKTSFQSKVSEAVSFVLDGKGYICTGYHNEYNKDFFMYDPQTNTWTEKRKIADVSDESYDDTYTIIRRRAVAFVVDSKAYVASGDINNSFKNDVWEYDPVEDLWTARTSFEGSNRNEAVAFTLEDGRGFVATGASGTIDFDDLWEFHPTEDYNEDD
jgi:N-acetylneuraminic acid mutarotase